MAVDISEAEVSAFVFIGELLVLNTQEVEGGGVEVVDMEGIFRGGKAEGIGLAEGHSSLDTASGHEHGAGLGVVISAGSLGHRGAAEFSAPDDEGVIEEATLFEVLNESSGTARKLLVTFAIACGAL